MWQDGAGLAFCGEAPEAQPWIVAHDWVLQLVVQESRKIDEGHRLGFRSEVSDIGVEFIARIPSTCEETLGHRIQGGSFGSVVEPVKAVGFCQQNLWIG